MRVKLSHHFALQRACLILGRIRETATLLAMSGRVTPMSVLGLATHGLGLVVGLAAKDIAEVAGGWPAVAVPSEIAAAVERAMAPTARRSVGGWTHCEAPGQELLLHSDGAARAEKDPEAAADVLREALWAATGPRARLRPGKGWDHVDLAASAEGAAHQSDRADAIWARIRPHLEAGEPRAVLLDGPPRTGKSTIVRRLLELEEARLGRPARVVRVIVSDFDWLRPSVVQAVAQFLRPDALVVDDLDRFSWPERLLDLFEAVRATTRLILTTSNDGARLPLALRLPGRIDEVERVEGLGPSAASAIAPTAWGHLTEAERLLVAAWPLGLARELELRVIRRGADPSAEVASLAALLGGGEKECEAKARAEDEAKATADKQAIAAAPA